MIKRLPCVLVAILLGLNVVPRMVSSGGTQRWFALSVPEPERFASKMHGQPTVTRVFGYPFICYSQMGHEFVTKTGRKLFWPSMEQPALATRFSFPALLGNVAVLLGLGALLEIATNRCSSKTGDRGVSGA